jgi:hypothetical protein
LRLRFFAEELEKIAVLSVPPITRTVSGITAKSGASVRIGKVMAPAVKAPVTAGIAAPTVPVASGKNLGTKISPATKTVPPVSGGQTLLK